MGLIESDASLTGSVGAPWAVDPQVYSLMLTQPFGTTLRFQWRANGAVIELPSGALAIKDARSMLAALGAMGLPGLQLPSRLVPAIDVSNAQKVDLAPYIRLGQAEHVVVKLYQTVEVAGGRTHALAQMQSALSQGCSVGGYVWLYNSVPIRQQIGDAVSLAQAAGITLPVLWLDIERYTDGTMPTEAQIRDAVAACRDLGVKPGIYTGFYIWQGLGNPSFPGVPLWSANYDGNPSLNTPSYGDMDLKAHQWTSTAPDGTGLDRSVFDSSVI